MENLDPVNQLIARETQGETPSAADFDAVSSSSDIITHEFTQK